MTPASPAFRGMGGVRLFPNWVVKHLPQPNLHTASWLKRPVFVFMVVPKMGKLEIKEYLTKLYNMPVSKVHTANYIGRTRKNKDGKKCAACCCSCCLVRGPRARGAYRYKEADFKKAYVYLEDEQGEQRPRYHLIEEQSTPEAMKSWPARPGQSAEELRARLRETIPQAAGIDRAYYGRSR